MERWRKNKQLSDVPVTTILIETGGDSSGYQWNFDLNIKFKDRESCLLIETFDESLANL